MSDPNFQPGMSQPGGAQPTYGQPAPQPAPYGQPAAKLPARWWSITMIVIGVLMIFPISLIVGAFGMVATLAHDGGEQFTSAMENSFTPIDAHGGTVTVNSDGVAILSIPDRSVDATCTLNGSTLVYELDTQRNSSSTTFSGSDIDPGTYTLDCEGLTGDEQLVVIDYNGVMGTMSTFTPALIAGIVTAVIGLTLVIAGIVFLVRTNRKRRQIQLQTYGW